MKQQLQWMGDDGNVSGTAKGSSLLCCFCQVDFERFLRFTERHLHIQSERWRSSMETEDTMMHAGEAEKSSPVNFRGFVFCSVWNVKVCLDWKQTFGPDLIRFRDTSHLQTEPLSFTYKLFLCGNRPQPRRETQPLRLASIPPALFPRPLLFLSGQQDGRSCIDARCLSLNGFILI